MKVATLAILEQVADTVGAGGWKSGSDYFYGLSDKWVIHGDTFTSRISQR